MKQNIWIILLMISTVCFGIQERRYHDSQYYFDDKNTQNLVDLLREHSVVSCSAKDGEKDMLDPDFFIMFRGFCRFDLHRIIVPCLIYKKAQNVSEDELRKFVVSSYDMKSNEQRTNKDGSVKVRYVGLGHIGRVYNLQELFQD